MKDVVEVKGSPTYSLKDRMEEAKDFYIGWGKKPKPTDAMITMKGKWILRQDLSVEFGPLDAGPDTRYALEILTDQCIIKANHPKYGNRVLMYDIGSDEWLPHCNRPFHCEERGRHVQA